MTGEQFSTVSQTQSLPGVGDLLKRTWQVYISRLGTFLGILIIPAVVALFFLLLSVALAFLKPIFIIFLVIAVIVVVVLNWWSSAAFLYAIKEREQRIGIKESFAKGWPKILSLFWVSLLVGLAGLGGLFLLVVPAIIFTIWFGFAPYVLVSEDLKGLNALFRSRQLVSGYWWGVFARLLILGAIMIVLLVGLHLFSLVLPVFGPIVRFGRLLFQNFVLIPIFTIYSFLLYEDLRKIKSEITFEPPPEGTRVKFVLVCLLGLLLLLLPAIIIISLRGAIEKAKEAQTFAAAAEIRSVAEQIYMEEGTYINVRCDHPQLAPLCKQIANISKEEPKIFSSPEAFCGYFRLPSGKFVCFDSQGAFEKDLTINPGQKGYCDGITFVCPKRSF